MSKPNFVERAEFFSDDINPNIYSGAPFFAEERRKEQERIGAIAIRAEAVQIQSAAAEREAKGEGIRVIES